MADIEYIRNLEKQLRERTHAQRLIEQQTDDQYYYDTFPVDIKKPYHVVRTGSGAKMVDLIVEHIETANPQASRDPREQTEKDRQGSLKVSKLVNWWLNELIAEIDEAVKNSVHRGEAVMWAWYNKDNSAIPIIEVPDPLNVFCVPHEALVPKEVIMSYEVNLKSLKAKYPKFEPQHPDAEKVKYLEYWSATQNYVEADEVTLINRKNYLGFMPFVHCFSGFGKRSPDGNPESLSVGRLRKHRGTLKDQCEIRSSIASIIHLYANPVMHIEQVDQNAASVDLEAMKNEVFAPGYTLLTPFGFKREILKGNVPGQEMYQYLAYVEGQLLADLPAVMQGLGLTEGGRSQDVAFEHVSKKYAKLIKNFEIALSKLMSICLEILDKTPKALPITVYGEEMEDGERVRKINTLTRDDLNGYYDVDVRLNPDEAIEQDRKVMLGRILVNEGRISWRRFLIDYMNQTQEDADQIIAEALAEQAVISDPAMRAIRTREAIEQMGMQKYLKDIQQDTQMQAQMQEDLSKNPVQAKRPSEATNPVARDTLRQALEGEYPATRKPAEVPQ